jgi:Tol biopolymer transport system component
LGGGGWVVFSSNRADGVTFQLWKMQIFVDNTGRAYSSEPIQITFDDGDKTQPAWSPEGTQLVYSAPAAKIAAARTWAWTFGKSI